MNKRHGLWGGAFFLLVASASWAQTNLLIAWDGGSTTNYAYVASGISGTVGGGAGIITVSGSTDGTFGTGFSGAETNGAASYSVVTSTSAKAKVSVEIQNDSAGNLVLSVLSFDYSPWFDNAPKTVTLTYDSGDLSVTVGTVINSVSGLATAAKKTDYPDYDWSLTGLTDYILAPGEKAKFNLIASDALGTSTSGSFDNIAISGGPEAARSLRLLGISN